jgi:hypothetical protein
MMDIPSLAAKIMPRALLVCFFRGHLVRVSFRSRVSFFRAPASFMALLLMRFFWTFEPDIGGPYTEKPEDPRARTGAAFLLKGDYKLAPLNFKTIHL